LKSLDAAAYERTWQAFLEDFRRVAAKAREEAPLEGMGKYPPAFRLRLSQEERPKKGGSERGSGPAGRIGLLRVGRLDTIVLWC